MGRGENLLAAAVVVGALLLAGLAVFWIEPLGVLGALERVTPNLRYRVRTKRPLVALSFDDGPHPEYTPRVLEILERFGAKATFFLIGERARQHPDIVARIRRSGHEVGNHYFKNASVLLHSTAEFAGNLERTEKELGLAGGRKLFRPPGGVARPGQLRFARSRGYECVLGCAYPHDPMRTPVWYMRWLVEKNLRPGTIVILHDGISDPSRSLEALPHILAAGSERKLEFVSIGTLMEEAGE